MPSLRWKFKSKSFTRPSRSVCWFYCSSMRKGEQIKPIRNSESKNSPALLGSRTKEPGQGEGRLLANWKVEMVRLIVSFLSLDESSMQALRLAPNSFVLAAKLCYVALVHPEGLVPKCCLRYISSFPWVRWGSMRMWSSCVIEVSGYVEIRPYFGYIPLHQYGILEKGGLTSQYPSMMYIWRIITA